VSRLDLLHWDLSVRYYNLGWTLIESAETHWQKGLALRAAGDAGAARVELARALQMRRLAENEYRRGAADYPDSDLLRDALLNALLVRSGMEDEIGDFDAALATALDLAARTDDFAPAFTRLGLAWERTGNRERAHEAFGRAAALDAADVEAAAGLRRTASRLDGARAND
jgi:tetratricopeptide (TPR) repeat protein